MYLLNNIFNKKYIYYIYFIVIKYIYKDVYEYFINYDYTSSCTKYIIDIDNIFINLLNMTEDNIYIFNEYYINNLSNIFKNKINSNTINTIKKKFIYTYNEIFKENSIDTFITIIRLLSDKIIIVFKDYSTFLRIFKDINKFNNLIGNFKNYKFILTILFKNEDLHEDLYKFIENNNLKYKIKFIDYLITFNYNNNKYINFKIKKFLNYYIYNNLKCPFSYGYINTIFKNKHNILINKKITQLESIKEYILKYFENNIDILDPVIKSINKSYYTFNENKPLNNFLLCGPSGAGKTELSKILTYAVFNSTKNLIKLNMSEYMEPHSISKLIGAPPGYSGYNECNEFINKINSTSRSVILFDEIEKAHKSINDLMLQIMEEGRLTLSNGNILKFNNSFIIFTSNLGCDNLYPHIKGVEYDNKILKSIKDFFRPEFISRLNNIIIFKPVDIINCYRAVEDIIKKINLNNSFYFNLENKIKKEFISYSYNILYGFRPLYRLNELLFSKLINFNNRINYADIKKNNSDILLSGSNVGNFKYNIYSNISLI